jgi:hypothetical protein
MFYEGMVKVKTRRCIMDNTHEFVEKLHERQRKDEQNKKRQGKGHPSARLPNKQHSQGQD